MGCRSINVLRLGLRMFSMNLSLSLSLACNTGARKAKQSRWHCCGCLSISMLVLSYLSDLFISDNLINLPDKTTEHNRI